MNKRIIYIIICCLIFTNTAIASVQKGEVSYEGFEYSFAPGACNKFLSSANRNMRLFELANTKQYKDYHLNEAMRFYFLVEKIDPSSIEAQIGLGRVYDEKKIDSVAKKHFCNACNLDSKNPYLNYYFGEFYYKRKDLVNAMTYFQLAFKYGLSNKFELNLQMATAYEKMADLEKAKKHYKLASHIKPIDNTLPDKIKSLESVNYSGSQYYLFNKSL